MEDTKVMGIVELRPVLGDRVDKAFFTKEPTIITKKDKPRAVLIPYEWYEELLAARAAKS